MLKFQRITTAQSAVNVVVGGILWIFMLPFLIFFFFPLVLVAWVHHFLAKIFRPDLSPSDGFEDAIVRLRVLTKSNCCTCQIWKISGKLDVNKLRSHFHNVFLSAPELKKQFRNLYCSIVKWGLYVYKKQLPEKVLDLNKLIREYDGPQFSSEFELDNFISKYNDEFSKSGDEPQWEGLLIYFEKMDESIFIFKSCHTLNDGYTWVNMISKLSGAQAPYLSKDDDMSMIRKLKIFLSTLKLVLQISSEFFFYKPMPFPNYTNKNASSEEFMISYTTLELEAVKKVRRLTGAHFNTVLGTLQIGATRRYCLDKLREEKGAKDQDLKDRLPQNFWLFSAASRPNHPAMIANSGTGMCNHLSPAAAKFPVKEECPLKRLCQGEESFLYQEDAGFSQIFYQPFIETMLASIPTKLYLYFDLLLIKVGFSRSINHLISPLMLSSQRHELCGHEVKHIFLPVQMKHVFRLCDMYVIPTSMGGNLDISVNASKRIFRDQKELDKFTKNYFKVELDNLIQAVNK